MDIFEEYIKGFGYDSPAKMRLDSADLINRINNGEKIQIIDVRFKEEYELWNISFLKHIPINELPERLVELDKDSLIVTVCPHKDRSNVAAHYLISKGYNAKYLLDGFVQLIPELTGGVAKKMYKTLGIERNS